MSHIARDRNIFVSYVLTPDHQIAGFGKVKALGRGTIKLHCTVAGNRSVQTLNDVLHAPDAPYNLISIPRASEAKITVLFMELGVKFKAPNS